MSSQRVGEIGEIRMNAIGLIREVESVSFTMMSAATQTPLRSCHTHSPGRRGLESVQ